MKILLKWFTVYIFIFGTFGQTGQDPNTCRPIADVVFLLDGSDSISDDEFLQQKELLQRFLQLSDVTADTVRVGAVVVSSAIGDSVPLAARDNMTALTSAITSLSQPMEGSRLDLGLTKTEQMLSTGGRPGVVRVGVVLTDGRAMYARATQGEADVVKNAGVFLVAVGVGRNIQFPELESMASTRSNAYPLLPLEISAKMLAETVNFLGQETCSGHALLNQLSTATTNVDPVTTTPSPSVVGHPVRIQQQPHLQQFQQLQTQQQQPQQEQQQQQLNLQQVQPFQQQQQQLPFQLPQGQMAPPWNAIILPQQVIAPQQMFSPEQALSPNMAMFESQPGSRSSPLTKFDLSSLKGVDMQPVSSPIGLHAANFTRISQELAKDAARLMESPVLGRVEATTTGPSQEQPQLSISSLPSPDTVSQPVQGHASQGVGTNNAQDLYQIFNMGSFKFEGKPPGPAMSNLLSAPVHTKQVPRPGKEGINGMANELSRQTQNFVVDHTVNGAADSASAQATQQVSNAQHQNAIDISNLAVPNMAVDQTVSLSNTQGPSQDAVNRAADPVISISNIPGANQPGPSWAADPAVTLTDKLGPNQPVSGQGTQPAFIFSGAHGSEQKAPSWATDPVINLSDIPRSNLLAQKLTITPREKVLVPPKTSLQAQAIINMVKQPLTKFLSDPTANAPQQNIIEKMIKEATRNTQPVADMLKDALAGGMNLAAPTGANVNSAVTTTPTPGGPTPSPYIHGIHRELAAHQCSQARNIDGVGYTFHPKSCMEFLQCFQREGGALHVQVAKCPFETFFDEELAVCRYHTQVTCYRDPCSDTDVISYRHSDNCRAYWDCGTNRKSRPQCCPYGSSYSPGYGCIRNTSCEHMCMDFGNLNKVVAASKCKHLAMDSDPKYYFESVAGVGWVIRTCPYGSRFQQASCTCRAVTEVKAMANNCNPELFLDFYGTIEDKSGNGLSLGNTNVELEGGTGVFDGTALLKLWRFSGVSFGQKVTVTFRFRVSVTAPKGKLMHLVSNCCYGCSRVPTPSIDVAIIPGHNGGIGVFSATTEAAGEIFVYVPYEDTITGWNRLTYTYNGRELTGRVNGAENRKQIIGDIVARSDPLTIGACNKDGAFQGYMDDVKFYLCDV